MKLARFAVGRPVFVSMVSCIVMILGAISLSRLPVDLMPDITYPTVSISTSYEDASPQEVEELVTKVVEDAVSAVTGVEEITSTSLEGRSNVRVSFTWGTDLDAATADIRDRIDRILSRLPDDADRPSVRKFDLAAFPILICGISTDIDLLEAQDIIDNQVQYRIERLPGVANLEIWGGHEREIKVELDLDKVKALGLSLDRMLAVIQAANITTPAGNIEEGPLDVRVRIPGTFATVDELADTVVEYRANAPIRLRDLAQIIDDKEDITRIVRVNGKPGLRMGVRKQSGANTVTVATGVIEEIERINRDIPQLDIVPLVDTSDYIKRSIRNVSSAAVYGSLLAIVVLLFFLRNLRSTLIIATSIPMSVIATFVMIYFGGFTLNIMTLGGLALGVGMLVDNSIVVLENITRHRDGGASRTAAAAAGTEEVASAILASTLTTLVVFLPLVFVRGMSGVMFRQLSLVVAFSLLCSFVSAISLVPMLAASLLRRSSHHDDGVNHWTDHFLHWSSRLFEALEERYGSVVDWALRHRLLVIVACVATLASLPLAAAGHRHGTHAEDRREPGQSLRGDGRRHPGRGGGRAAAGSGPDRGRQGTRDDLAHRQLRRQRLALQRRPQGRHHHQPGAPGAALAVERPDRPRPEQGARRHPGRQGARPRGAGALPPAHGLLQRREPGHRRARTRVRGRQRTRQADQRTHRGGPRRHRHPDQPRPRHPRDRDPHRPPESRRHEALRPADRRRPQQPSSPAPGPATSARAATSTASSCA